MTKEEITNRAAEIEISVAQGEAMLNAQYEAFEKALIHYHNALETFIASGRQMINEYKSEAKALHKELLKLKNRENKPKGDRRITNATICRLLNISESILKARLLRLGVMHRHWGYMEVQDTWYGKVRLTGRLDKDGKTKNIWVWTEEGKEKFIKLHNEQSWK